MNDNKILKFMVLSKSARKSEEKYQNKCRKYTVFEQRFGYETNVLISTDDKYEFLMWMDLRGFEVGKIMMVKESTYRIFGISRKLN